ncbi:hypothetical protein D3C86_1048790 [compost metagenome]
MLENLEGHLNAFLPKAKELNMDVTLRTKLSFEDNATQFAFNLFSQGYCLGVRDGQKDVYERTYK